MISPFKNERNQDNKNNNKCRYYGSRYKLPFGKVALQIPERLEEKEIIPLRPRYIHAVIREHIRIISGDPVKICETNYKDNNPYCYCAGLNSMPRPKFMKPLWIRRGITRSEEHTTELSSQFYLL